MLLLLLLLLLQLPLLLPDSPLDDGKVLGHVLQPWLGLLHPLQADPGSLEVTPLHHNHAQVVTGLHMCGIDRLKRREEEENLSADF